MYKSSSADVLHDLFRLFPSPDYEDSMCLLLLNTDRIAHTHTAAVV